MPGHTTIVIVAIVAIYSANPLLAADSDIPRTPFGHPDLQGLWTNSTFTPLERDEALGTKKNYTLEEALEQEAGKLDEHNEKSAPIDPDRPPPPEVEAVGNEAEFVFLGSHLSNARVNGEYRTSLIVEPENGRIPLLEGTAENSIFGQWRARGFGDFDGPEIRPPGERCLSDFGLMPPLLVVPASSNFQIVQTENHVMLLGEPGTEARIIRLDAEHDHSFIKKWHGDSIAHWEGDTLVVHTTNFHPQHTTRNFFVSDKLEIEERYTWISADEIFYRYEVTNPDFYSQPWAVENTLSRMPAGDIIYEYACHEGNYSLPGILAGARRQEMEPVEGVTEYLGN